MLNRHGDDSIRFDKARKRMVKGLRKHNIDDKVLGTMERIPRHLFVPELLRDQAYADYPLSIGDGQTIRQKEIGISLLLI